MPDPLPGPRLRQVALVAHDCEKTATALQETFGWPDPFHDPGVRHRRSFGRGGRRRSCDHHESLETSLRI